jgi:hypothetical protein
MFERLRRIDSLFFCLFLITGMGDDDEELDVDDKWEFDDVGCKENA